LFVEFEEGGGVFELAALVVAAVGLDAAEVLESFLELAREAAVGVDDGQTVVA
jgi:hypothetical protein